MAEKTYQQISQQEAKRMMDEESDFLILDVREADEFAEGHIANALQLSYTKVDELAEAMLPDKNRTILVYCRSGRRSKIAAQALAELDYTDVREFGGIIDWPYEIVK